MARPGAAVATTTPRDDPASGWRKWLADQRAELRAAYLERPEPRLLLRRHAAVVDTALIGLWQSCALPADWALVAVGGYGRATLFPHSDVDVLVLVPEGAEAKLAEPFIGMLWDCGIEPGHSVRTPSECVEEAERDVTVLTSLLETRLITGNRALFADMAKATRKIVKPRDFFNAKLDEQRSRHTRALDAAFRLEPNIKENPGGLRDLQTIHWVADAAGMFDDSGTGWQGMAREGLITRGEALRIAKDERVLQDLRIRLHFLAGRREDRLVFDHQNRLAAEMGIHATASKRPSELLMQRYYRAAKSIYRLNTILLQNIWARIGPPRDMKVVPIDDTFARRGATLEILKDDAFIRDPSNILRAMHHLQKLGDLEGPSADALRALWRALPLIDAKFRANPVNRALFMDILREPKRVTFVLRKMNHYGILARYLPAFGRIVGQMQHDLFHVYTVDEHILMVVRNLRRFIVERFAHEYPFCSELMRDFERKEVLILAALFHDIAKGRGGDHSELGAGDARRFCRAHGLAPGDTDLVVWLVEQHLTMSQTAQKQDLSDPEVIANFALKVGNERCLTALYLLTVADIRGTSPHVWNAWKGKLLEDLFKLTRKLLSGERAPIEAWIEGKKAEALRIFAQYVTGEGRHEGFWAQLHPAYFQRFEASEIAWHTRALWSRPSPENPVVKARLSPIGEGLQVMVYTPDQPGVFARICTYFERMHLDIAAAKIYTTQHGYALDSFQVLPRARTASGDLGGHYRDVIARIEEELARQLKDAKPLPAPASGRVSRQVKHFPIEPAVNITPERRAGHFAVQVIAADRPGLLTTVARHFLAHGLSLHDARITTLGNRAEDVFVVEGETLARAEGAREFKDGLLQVLKT
ncbi:MAG: [protein-PII] uridylyltransferase [Burkholderiales bacterium]|nr:[protein-PII] uridylyltransferase [Burkholderiales bacterium]